VYSCGGGIKSFAIDPNGNMSICVLSHQDTYDIRQGSVRQGWDEFLLKVRQKQRAHPLSKCVQCRIHSVCSMCPANGELENGDPESPVEFLCEVAHLRAKALGFNIPEHGDCEFCLDEGRKAELSNAVRRIVSKEINPENWMPSQPALRVLNEASASSGCGGCGSFH
jgi:radical SAM protein with 4Fe4S-binding SPASM domain